MSKVIKDLYASVTNQIIAALEAGTPPWVCPWARGYGSVLPFNLMTKRPYRGVNVLLLNLQQMAHGYPVNRWLTFQQARSISGSVRKGETGTTIVFFKMLECGPTQRAANDEPGRKVIPLIRSFTVFNAAQIDGLPRVMTTPSVAPEGWTPILAAEQLLERSGAALRHGGDRAFYRPSDDIIQMPPRVVFPDAGHYYATALHELTHWTGAPSR